MAEGYLLSKKSAQRLGEAVRHVERQRVARTKSRRPILNTGEGGTFPVRVEYTSGINGDASAAAQYLYTVRSVDYTGAVDQDPDNFIIAANAGQSKPRPNGSMIYQPGDTGYGLAFYDSDGAIVLWDAGEVQETGDCP